MFQLLRLAELVEYSSCRVCLLHGVFNYDVHREMISCVLSPRAELNIAVVLALAFLAIVVL